MRLAGVLVGVQGLVGVGFAVALGVGPLAPGVGDGSVLGEAGYFVLIGLRWSPSASGSSGAPVGADPCDRHPTAAAPGGLLADRAVAAAVLGIVAGVFVVATFMLLISERSREWSMGLDLPDAKQR